MHIIITLQSGTRIPMKTPLGAIAFAVRETVKDGRPTVSVLFAMAKDGEPEISGLIRVRRENATYQWTPTSARAGRQVVKTSYSGKYAERRIVYTADKQWRLEDEESESALKQIEALITPVLAVPSRMVDSLEAWEQATDTRVNPKTTSPDTLESTITPAQSVKLATV